MDPKGVLEMLLIFLEDRGDGVLSHPSLDSNTVSPLLVINDLHMLSLFYFILFLITE